MTKIQQHDIDAVIEDCLQTKMRTGVTATAIIYKIAYSARRFGLGFNFATGKVGEIFTTEDGCKCEILATV